MTGSAQIFCMPVFFRLSPRLDIDRRITKIGTNDRYHVDSTVLKTPHCKIKMAANITRWPPQSSVIFSFSLNDYKKAIILKVQTLLIGMTWTCRKKIWSIKHALSELWSFEIGIYMVKKQCFLNLKKILTFKYYARNKNCSEVNIKCLYIILSKLIKNEWNNFPPGRSALWKKKK